MRFVNVWNSISFESCSTLDAYSNHNWHLPPTISLSILKKSIFCPLTSSLALSKRNFSVFCMQNNHSFSPTRNFDQRIWNQKYIHTESTRIRWILTTGIMRMICSRFVVVVANETSEKNWIDKQINWWRNEMKILDLRADLLLLLLLFFLSEGFSAHFQYCRILERCGWFHEPSPRLMCKTPTLKWCISTNRTNCTFFNIIKYRTYFASMNENMNILFVVWVSDCKPDENPPYFRIVA